MCKSSEVWERSSQGGIPKDLSWLEWGMVAGGGIGQAGTCQITEGLVSAV